jgi:hypothetical protein
MEIYCGQKISCHKYLIAYRLEGIEYFTFDWPCMDYVTEPYLLDCNGENVCIEDCSSFAGAEVLGYVGVSR